MHWLDPDYLPETTGTVVQFLINPHGEIDGMIFKNGAEIHFPPHLSIKIGKAVAIGDKIKVRGVRPRGADVIAGVAVETAKGDWIVDDGPPDDHKDGKHDRKARAEASTKPASADGIVRYPLHGPKGEIRGVLLEDGTAIRFPKHEGERLKAQTNAGAKFAARGHAVTTRFGAVLNAHEIGSSEKTLRALKQKGPKHHDQGKSHGPEKHAAESARDA